MSLIKNQIAYIYQDLISPKILELKLSEKRATCDKCLMTQACIRKSDRYKADLKCCTYWPFLPNFIVGEILQDLASPGSKIILDWVDTNKDFLLPIGILPDLSYQRKFNHREKGDFGNRLDFLCPYFDKIDNNCSIWRQRGSVCTSFYCRSNYGLVGKSFWNKFSNYMSYLEMALMEEALIRQDYSPRKISDNLAYFNYKAHCGKIPFDKLNELWDRKMTKEGIIEFYKKSYEIVQQFTPEYMLEVLGDLGLELQNKILLQYNRLSKIKQNRN